MTESTNASKPHRSIAWRIGKIVLIVIGSLVGLVIVLALLLLTPPVQNFARKKVQVYMSNKLKTRFEIGGMISIAWADIRNPTLNVHTNHNVLEIFHEGPKMFFRLVQLNLCKFLCSDFFVKSGYAMLIGEDIIEEPPVQHL